MAADPRSSLEERFRVILTRLEVAHGLLSLALDDAEAGGEDLALDHLGQAKTDLETLVGAVPFPLLEWRGEPIGEWLRDRAPQERRQ